MIAGQVKQGSLHTSGVPFAIQAVDDRRLGIEASMLIRYLATASADAVDNLNIIGFGAFTGNGYATIEPLQSPLSQQDQPYLTPQNSGRRIHCQSLHQQTVVSSILNTNESLSVYIKVVNYFNSDVGLSIIYPDTAEDSIPIDNDSSIYLKK